MQASTGGTGGGGGFASGGGGGGGSGAGGGSSGLWSGYLRLLETQPVRASATKYLATLRVSTILGKAGFGHVSKVRLQSPTRK